MLKAPRIRKISVFTSSGRFPVLTLSYINTALSQSAFRIYKCYIIIFYIILFYRLKSLEKVKAKDLQDLELQVMLLFAKSRSI